MKGLITLLFLFYLGSIPSLIWQVLGENTKTEIAKGYGFYYLTQKDYCAEATVKWKIMKITELLSFMECDKVKI